MKKSDSKNERYVMTPAMWSWHTYVFSPQFTNSSLYPMGVSISFLNIVASIYTLLFDARNSLYTLHSFASNNIFESTNNAIFIILSIVCFFLLL